MPTDFAAILQVKLLEMFATVIALKVSDHIDIFLN